MTLEEVQAVSNTKRSTRNKRSSSPQPGPSSAKQFKQAEPGTDSSPPLSALAKFYCRGTSIICQHVMKFISQHAPNLHVNKNSGQNQPIYNLSDIMINKQIVMARQAVQCVQLTLLYFLSQTVILQIRQEGRVMKRTLSTANLLSLSLGYVFWSYQKINQNRLFF